MPLEQLTPPEHYALYHSHSTPAMLRIILSPNPICMLAILAVQSTREVVV